ncbi:MAG: c(7)-type cytochrome triheme domain-containing protein [Thermoanaerobaculia bacterium]
MLSVFFDGLPEPTEERVEESLLEPGPNVPPPPTPATGDDSARARRARNSPPVVPLDQAVIEGLELAVKAPLENVTTWQEALTQLPTDYAGGVDWVQAIKDGLIEPRALPEPQATPFEPPFRLETFATVAAGFPDRPVLDLDLELVPESDPFFTVDFPHASHTLWLTCSSCHPGAATLRKPMDRILAGEGCGKCHGRVSYDPELSCARCHSSLMPASDETVDAELARALDSPLVASDELIKRGQQAYQRYCALCHGDAGDGQGRMAPWVDPKPRDFTAGKYKFRSTIGASLPTDYDIFRTITRGVPGSSMPSWIALSTEDRWALTHFVKSFSPRFANEEPDEPITIPETPEVTAELVEQGRAFYRQAGCQACHGDTGRADGASAETLKDEWGDPILPYNFAAGRPPKSGSGIRDMYRVVMTGFPGTPMPGFGQFLQPEQAWQLAAFILSFAEEEPSPFAVKGDIHFERRELSEAELAAEAQIALNNIEGLSPDELAGVDELFLLAGKDTPPATFPHWFHRIRFKCASCHPSVFEMKAGANPITMTAMRRGEFCATCHNGRIAWEIGFTTCVRCHVAN